jgi:hypothetical protein
MWAMTYLTGVYNVHAFFVIIQFLSNILYVKDTILPYFAWLTTYDGIKDKFI